MKKIPPGGNKKMGARRKKRGPGEKGGARVAGGGDLAPFEKV